MNGTHSLTIPLDTTSGVGWKSAEIVQSDWFLLRNLWSMKSDTEHVAFDNSRSFLCVPRRVLFLASKSIGQFDIVPHRATSFFHASQLYLLSCWPLAMFRKRHTICTERRFLRNEHEVDFFFR